MKIELRVLEAELSIAKLASIENIELLATEATFFALTKTNEEVSLVIDSGLMPDNEYVNEGWRAMGDRSFDRIDRPRPLSLVRDTSASIKRQLLTCRGNVRKPEQCVGNCITVLP